MKRKKEDAILTFTSDLRANLADNKLMFFLFFSRKQDLSFHANCLHLIETICMQCYDLSSGKNLKNISTEVFTQST